MLRRGSANAGHRRGLISRCFSDNGVQEFERSARLAHADRYRSVVAMAERSSEAAFLATVNPARTAAEQPAVAAVALSMTPDVDSPDADGFDEPLAEAGVTRCPPKRLLFVALGSICFAIATVGVLLPIVPTTFPLMLSLMFFARSSVTLERKVRGFPLFKPYIKYIDGSTPMPMRAKLISCVMMWTPVLITAWLLATRTEAPPAAWIGTIMLAVIGTPVIFFWRPKLVG